VAKLSQECNLMPGDVGKILDKTVAAKIKWDNQNSYDQLEMVAVKCPDGAIKYGCIYKKNRYLVS